MVLSFLIVLVFSFTESQLIDNDFNDEKPQKVVKDSLEIRTLMNVSLPSSLMKERSAKSLKGRNNRLSTKREYFCIMSKSHSEVALVASVTKVGEVLIKVTNGVVRSQELWFWDGVDQNILRNKKYPKKVIN